jgi:hypothetical protein
MSRWIHKEQLCPAEKEKKRKEKKRKKELHEDWLEST